ncbi:MAG: hypothetical protein RIR18_1915 [Pseudomonadota bacterium]|jgi:hypothetical protein
MQQIFGASPRALAAHGNHSPISSVIAELANQTGKRMEFAKTIVAKLKPKKVGNSTQTAANQRRLNELRLNALLKPENSQSARNQQMLKTLLTSLTKKGSK